MPPSPSASADPAETAVVVALRVKGRARGAALAHATGLAEAETLRAIDALCARGLAETAAEGVRLTERGRAAAARLAASGVDRAAVARFYEAFLARDAEVKARITGWQLAPDALAKRTALAGVAALVEPAGALVGTLAAVVPRLARYRARLDRAAAALAAGDTRFVASPRVDSLHQVWFELHEELLLVLGRERGT